MDAAAVFVTGGTGYMGQALIALLLARGHAVHALSRPGSEGKLPRGALVVTGDALDGATFAGAIPQGATLVHLVGTPHPSPAKAAEFERVDLASIRATAFAATQARAAHIVYVSVAHPAPVMHAYIAVREQGEAMVTATGIPATILRPWYVLGPGHYWPWLLTPLYALGRLFPSTREQATRLGLVTLQQMVTALTAAVESPPSAGVRIFGVPAIRQAQLGS
ncbi:MAG: NAD(P)H-binding protein [Casimicrobiaceae bacterium]